MLRNSEFIVQNLTKTRNARKIAQRHICVAINLHAKATYNATNSQSKIMNKLFGARIAGSKKRWVPTSDTQSEQSVVFRASQFGKPPGAGAGKNTTRRMTVLNKLFMKHITDLLATGEASETVIGRGMQVTRLKITQDFALINVYWLGNGKPLEEEELEKDLNACAGRIRHELSQLCLMGEVPRIKFVRDKKFANINEVECLLRNMNFDEMQEDAETENAYDAAQTVKNEFYGKTTPAETNMNLKESADSSETLPAMRHDVLGLDHRNIMSKILAKMRKSKEAWDMHSQGLPATNTETIATTALERTNEKLAQLAESAKNFDAYLAKRRERKNTPERKKYRRDDEVLPQDEAKHSSEELLLTDQQRKLYQLDDFIEEENGNERRV